jgi:hypothetical protein
MSGSIKIPAGAHSASLSAVITRADGSKENLGVIAYYHKSLFRRIAWRVRQLFGIPQTPVKG